jgi:hypothetical protein
MDELAERRTMNALSKAAEALRDGWTTPVIAAREVLFDHLKAQINAHKKAIDELEMLQDMLLIIQAPEDSLDLIDKHWPEKND